MPPALAPLVLASASPRRAELLAEAGLEFETAPAQLDERALPGESPGQTCRRLAAAKAAAARAGRSRGTLLGGDTLIEHEGRLLGKPRDERDAATMLAALAGRRHRVWSAVALVHVPTGLAVDGLEGADVELLPLSAGWLPGYLASGEWRDKAGAYAIQGRAAAFTRLVEGELDTVVGLPRRLLRELLARLAASVEATPR